MVLSIVPDGHPWPFDEEILAGDQPNPQVPAMHEFVADNREQTITHVSSGCKFRAYLTNRNTGQVIPILQEIAVRFAGMADDRPVPLHDRIRGLGRHGIAWIKKHTSEAQGS